MASPNDEQILHIIELAIAIVMSVATSIITVYHFIFKRGVNKANGDNRIKLIEQRVAEIQQRQDRLEQKFADKEKQANETHMIIREDIVKVKTILESLEKRLDSET